MTAPIPIKNATRLTKWVLLFKKTHRFELEQGWLEYKLLWGKVYIVGEYYAVPKKNL